MRRPRGSGGPGRGPGGAGAPGLLWAEGALAPTLGVPDAPSVHSAAPARPGPPTSVAGPFPPPPGSTFRPRAPPARCVSRCPCAKGVGNTFEYLGNPRRPVRRGESRPSRSQASRNQTGKQPGGLGSPGAGPGRPAGLPGKKPRVPRAPGGGPGGGRACSCSGRAEPHQGPTLGHLGPSPRPRKGLIYGPGSATEGGGERRPVPLA